MASSGDDTSAADTATDSAAPAAEAEASASSDVAGAEGAAPEDDMEARAAAERRRIEEQLAQLEKKQAELRRALAIAHHPALSDAIREIEGRTYAVSRAEKRLEQPLSKSEERTRAKLEKKLEAAKKKRTEIEEAITGIEAELVALGEERLRGLTEERGEALRTLFVLIARHADAFEEAGLLVVELVPDLDRYLPELRAMAEQTPAVEA